MVKSDGVPVAIVSNELTPYRQFFLERAVAGLPNVDLHCLFTSDPASKSMPWRDPEHSPFTPIYFDAYTAYNKRRRPLRELALAKQIIAYLTQHQVKFIILHGYADLARYQLIRWAHKQGIPLLVRGDSNILAEGRLPTWKLALKRTLLRWVLRDVSGTMVMGSPGRAFFRMHCNSNKPTFMLPYYPDLDKFRSTAAALPAAWLSQRGLDPQRKRFLYSGRMVPHKRVDLVLDAFIALANDRPDWDLCLAGDGPQAQALKAKVPASLESRVHWLGFLQFDELCACYSACDVLVHASAFEPWGIIIPEAMAAGLAVICTSVTGSAADLVEDGVTGLLVEPGDGKALALAMGRASQGDTYQQWGQQGQARIAAWQKQMDPAVRIGEALAYFDLDGT